MTSGSESATATVTLTNTFGLHSRSACKFADTAKRYRGCRIRVTCAGNECDGKSTIDLTTLGARCGAIIRMEADGDEASEAVAALRELVDNRFGETAVVTGFLDPACVKVPLLGETREDVIQELMDLIDRRHNVTCADRLVSQAMKREIIEPGGTSVALGIAFPHAKEPECPGLFAAMGRLQMPIDWGAIDGKPVWIVYLTVGPDESYQRAIEDMSRVLSCPSARQRVITAPSAYELYKAIDEETDALTQAISKEVPRGKSA